MNELVSEFLNSNSGKSFYRELYHLNDSDNTVVVDETTGRQYVRKSLDYYDIKVFEYIRNHPDKHIPAIKEFHQVDGKLIVYEEYIAGRTLEEVIDSENVTDADKKRIINEICDGISYFHNAINPIVHRDIKMSNIMITNDGLVKIIDFDAAKIINNNSSRDTVLLGTEGYAAPEQYGFGKSDIRTDIFALGKLVERVFGDSHKYRYLVEKSTSIDPDNRYSSIRTFRYSFNNGGYFLPFPGFRKKSIFHQIRSVAGYILLSWLITGLTVKSYSLQGNIVVRILLAFTVLGWIDMLSGISPIFTRTPLTSSENIIIRYVGYVLYIVISFAIAIILASAIVNLFNL